ncbi:MAG: hypothetical protein CMM75_03495, partial [Rhodospirillaceae bacterium]|nr:hypothetical protein [Rhodospirillaceae bacterium]
FIHGVMNTDNMTLSGETIDYGPCAFIDEYDPNTVFSSIDRMGRYAFANQPQIAQWNLTRLAEALLPLIDPDLDKSIQLAEENLNLFLKLYEDKFLNMMRQKLGLFGAQKGDHKLVSDLLDWMHKNNADYTNTFRHLAEQKETTHEIYKSKIFVEWNKRWRARQEQNKMPVKAALNLMEKTNPAVIPRNHNVEMVLDSAHEGNLDPLHNLLRIIKNPYKGGPHLQNYQSPPSPSQRVYQTFCGT